MRRLRRHLLQRAPLRAGYSPAPHLLIATVALRTSKIRLGVMGVVPAYHSPWQVVEEIGMLDHLTRGRLEIGTAAGIPQEMAQVGLGVDEARARYDEAMEILDKALAEPVISHHGTFWNFDDLRPVQQPSPPKWVTVVSASSARRAAQRGAKICTGFHPQDKIAEIFDAYREESEQLGRSVGPEDLCVRRQVTLLEDDRTREQVLDSMRTWQACGRRSRKACWCRRGGTRGVMQRRRPWLGVSAALGHPPCR